MTGRAGDVGFTGVIELLTAANSLVIPTISYGRRRSGRPRRLRPRLD